MSDIKVRFCTSCQALKPEADGRLKQTRGVPRWLCKACVDRKSPSIYRSQAPTTPAELERARLRQRRDA